MIVLLFLALATLGWVWHILFFKIVFWILHGIWFIGMAMEGSRGPSITSVFYLIAISAMMFPSKASIFVFVLTFVLAFLFLPRLEEPT